MTACRLQSPNWWRTARDALAAAWTLLDDVPGPAPHAADEHPVEDRTGVDMQRAVAAIRSAIEAAVALRLPYTALQPAEAWALGWRAACCDTARDGAGGNSDSVLASCGMALVAAGVRCRREGIPPLLLAAALGHAERTLAVCYTERREAR